MLIFVDLFYFNYFVVKSWKKYIQFQSSSNLFFVPRFFMIIYRFYIFIHIQYSTLFCDVMSVSVQPEVSCIVKFFVLYPHRD